MVGGVDMVELAREAGTALYVMDEEHVRHQLREYVKWTTYHWKDVDVVYAGKAFMSLAMVRLVAGGGRCLDVSSGGELAYALRAGFPMERIYVHGNNKTRRRSWPSASTPAWAASSWTASRRWSVSRRMAAERGVAAAGPHPRHARHQGGHARLHPDRRRRTPSSASA